MCVCVALLSFRPHVVLLFIYLFIILYIDVVNVVDAVFL